MSGSLTEFRPAREEAEGVYRLMANYFAQRDLIVKPAGSFAYSPNAATYGDVDIIVGYNDPSIMEDCLKEIFGVWDNGRGRTQGIIGRTQVDIFPCESRCIGAVELFYGNPLSLQLALRAIAATRGYSLTPRGLVDKNTGMLVETPSITSAYRFLGVDPFNNQDLERANAYRFDLRSIERKEGVS